MGNKKSKKTPIKIGLTEQLLRKQDKQERKNMRDFKKSRQSLITRMTDAINKACDVLEERDDITGFELIEVADHWLVEPVLNVPTKLIGSVLVPTAWLAGLSSQFEIDGMPIYLVPDERSLVVIADKEFDDADVYLVMDAETIIDALLFKEVEATVTAGAVPSFNELLWIIEWLDDLVKEPSAPKK